MNRTYKDMCYLWILYSQLTKVTIWLCRFQRSIRSPMTFLFRADLTLKLFGMGMTWKGAQNIGLRSPGKHK